MSRSNRNNPRRATSSESRYTIYEFDRDFPDDAACLNWLVGHLYPAGIYCPTCQKVTKHHRVKARTCYACQFCGHQEYPLVGTIFENSATSLKLWFHGFFLMAQTRCGISAKQLERELGVTYKTAWRMFHKIRSLLQDDDDSPLSGDVEIDETFVGGKPRLKDNVRDRSDARRWLDQKDKVFGMVERGGRVRVRIVEDRGGSLLREVGTHVLDSSMIFSDEWRAYRNLGQKYRGHKRIRHGARIYVEGDVHTNTIEGFFGLLKNGIRGVYHAVSTEHLQSYLDEYAFRYNHRDISGRGMVEAMLHRIRKAQQVPASVS